MTTLILVCGHRNSRQVPTNPFDPNFGRQLSESIQRDVNSALHRSMGLADAINQQVQVQLRPVHRMQLRNRMAQGTGGTCVITYETKIHFVNDGVSYNCPSNQVVRQENGPPKCTEDLVIDDLQDPCTFDGKGVSVIGNYYCFGENVIMSCLNNNCTCQGGKAYTLDYLKKQCGSSFGTRAYAKYNYYPDILGVGAIDFNSDSNKALNLCDYSDQYSCQWTDAGWPSVI